MCFMTGHSTTMAQRLQLHAIHNVCERYGRGAPRGGVNSDAIGSDLAANACDVVVAVNSVGADLHAASPQYTVLCSEVCSLYHT